MRLDPRVIPFLFPVLWAGVCTGLKAESRVLPDYQPVPGVSGVLDSVGSDSLNTLMSLWAEAFQKIYPNVTVQVEGKGSSTAPPALIEGTAQIGPMSRLMKDTEIDQFEAHFGYQPQRVAVALDTLAIFVHKDNPLPSITLAQLDAIFSSTLKRGHRPVLQWRDLGLTENWAPRWISAYGRNSASGTYGFFKDEVLLNGDFRLHIREQPGSSSVVQAVAGDLYGIGYSGIGYRTSGVRILPVASGDRSPVSPSRENCLSGAYPIARLLYLYINRNPREPVNPLIREFIRFVLSRQGQAIVETDGYYSLPAEIARRYTRTLNEE